MDESRQPPPSTTATMTTKTEGVDESQNPAEDITLPSEAEMVLLCLDYLRDLRRAYEPQDLLEAEGLHADYLSVAIYSLNRAFISPPTLNRHNGNDPFMERGEQQSLVPKKNLPRPEIFDDVSHFPPIEAITAEVLYTENPHEEEEKQQEHSYDWYEYDDAHTSNIHRHYLLNGLASGPTLNGPLGLPEITAAGLTSLQSRSRSSAEKEMITSPLFEQFVQAVKSKGFFRDPDNETPRNDPSEEADRIARKKDIYEDRFNKVVSKFRTKLASKAQSGDLQGSLMTETTEKLHKRRNGRTTVVRDLREVKREEQDSSLPTRKGHRKSASVVSNLAKRLAPPARSTKNAESKSAINPEDLKEAEKLKSLGNVHMQRKEYQEASSSYTKALKLSPSGPSSHVYFSNRAAALLSMKRFEEAIHDSERSLALRPNYGKAHARLGLAHFLLGNYRLAMEAYTVALKYEPDNKSSKSYLEKAAKRLAASGDVDDHASLTGQSFSVVTEWDKSQKVRKASHSTDGRRGSHDRAHPNNDEFEMREAEKHKVRGNAHMADREYKTAFEAYTAALELCPHGPQSHVYYSNRAAALCYLERYAEAAQDSEYALQMKPTYGKAHARLGLSRFFMHDYEGAISAYTAALHHDPNNVASKSYLAKAKLRLEQQMIDEDDLDHVESDARRLLNDPDMHMMAKQALTNPSKELMEDPEMQRIARKAMSDPAMMEAVRAVPHVQSP